MKPPKRAVVLLSGGIDSTTTLAIALERGFEAHTLTFRYGQRHAVEVEAAARIAKLLGAADARTAEIDLRAFGGSALTSDDISVPKGRTEKEIGAGIPVTYVPARNTIFLAYALALAEVLETGDIFVGVNALDYSGYPDCRPEFIRAFETTANLATKLAVEGKRPVRIHAPLIEMTKAEIVRTGAALGVDYSLTVSCYDPDAGGGACGECDSCLLRRKGFLEAGLEDPTRYTRGSR